MKQSFFNSNIKLLRKRRGRTQDDVAHALNMKRSTLSGYENSVSEPNMQALLVISTYYNIAIDTLIKVDMSLLSESQMNQIERGYDVYLRGSNLRVLATTVDDNNNENIELVNVKAQAGYTRGFADPEYVKVLPTFQLPFLSRNRKYRTFQISGDSMLPIPDKSFVTGEFVQNWQHIRNNHPYIIITMDEGVVFKVVENNILEEGRLQLHSLNPLYEPYNLDIKEVKEIWKFVHYISSEMPEPNMPKEKLTEEVQALKQQVRAIQTKLKLE